MLQIEKRPAGTVRQTIAVPAEVRRRSIRRGREHETLPGRRTRTARQGLASDHDAARQEGISGRTSSAPPLEKLIRTCLDLFGTAARDSKAAQDRAKGDTDKEQNDGHPNGDEYHDNHKIRRRHSAASFKSRKMSGRNSSRAMPVTRSTSTTLSNGTPPLSHRNTVDLFTFGVNSRPNAFRDMRPLDFLN